MNQAASTITWATPTAITYGTALSGTQLNATAMPSGGTFIYTPAAGTILPAGTNTLSVIYTPSNANYATQTATVQLVVNKAASTITWATSDSDHVWDGALGDAVERDGGAERRNLHLYTGCRHDPSCRNEHAECPLHAIERKLRDTDGDGQLVVNQAASTITWATPTAITYGTALSARS